LNDERRYLRLLADDTRRLIVAGIPIGQAVYQIGVSERYRWARCSTIITLGTRRPRSANVEWE
jgi:hypothetical protein